MKYEIWSEFGTCNGELLHTVFDKNGLNHAMHIAEKAMYNGYKKVQVIAFDKNDHYVYSSRVSEKNMLTC